MVELPPTGFRFAAPGHRNPEPVAAGQADERVTVGVACPTHRRTRRHIVAKFELYKDARGEYRWRLKSANGQTIATGGEGYNSKAGAQNGINAVKRDAPNATVDDQS